MNALHSADAAQRSPPAVHPAPQFLVAGLSVTVPGKTLLRDISTSFAAGQVTAIVGPNGAGKSTLMAVLTGQRQPSGGRVALHGQALGQFDAAALAKLRAFVAQETSVAFDFSVREVVELGRYPHRRPSGSQPGRPQPDIPTQAMQATAVDHLANRTLNTLSGGEKARVHLARALAQVWEDAAPNPTRWLLLDEPTAALDLAHQHRVLKLVRQWATGQGVGVVAVLHDLNLALRYSDCCVVLQQGQMVASGITAEVLTPARIASVWGVAAQPVVPTCAPGVATPSCSLQYVFEPVDVVITQLDN